MNQDQKTKKRGSKRTLLPKETPEIVIPKPLLVWMIVAYTLLLIFYLVISIACCFSNNPMVKVVFGDISTIIQSVTSVTLSTSIIKESISKGLRSGL